MLLQGARTPDPTGVPHKLPSADTVYTGASLRRQPTLHRSHSWYICHSLSLPLVLSLPLSRSLSLTPSLSDSFYPSLVMALSPSSSLSLSRCLSQSFSLLRNSSSLSTPLRPSHTHSLSLSHSCVHHALLSPLLLLVSHCCLTLIGSCSLAPRPPHTMGWLSLTLSHSPSLLFLSLTLPL